MQMEVRKTVEKWLSKSKLIRDYQEQLKRHGLIVRKRLYENCFSIALLYLSIFFFAQFLHCGIFGKPFSALFVVMCFLVGSLLTAWFALHYTLSDFGKRPSGNDPNKEEP